MPAASESHGAQYSFTVTIDGVKMDHIQEVSIGAIEIEKLETWENTAKAAVRTVVPGVKKGGEITITKLAGKEDHAWQTVMAGAIAGTPLARKGGAITIFDAAHEELITITIPAESLITKFEGSAGKANDTSVRTHKITLAHPGLHISAGDIIG
jgi:phage tail-like protein